MLISFPDEHFHAETWSWPEFYTYVMLAPGTNPKNLEGKFPAIAESILRFRIKATQFQKPILPATNKRYSS
jgi:putative ABC transport system permease protein